MLVRKFGAGPGGIPLFGRGISQQWRMKVDEMPVKKKTTMVAMDIAGIGVTGRTLVLVGDSCRR